MLKNSFACTSLIFEPRRILGPSEGPHRQKNHGRPGRVHHAARPSVPFSRSPILFSRILASPLTAVFSLAPSSPPPPTPTWCCRHHCFRPCAATLSLSHFSLSLSLFYEYVSVGGGARSLTRKLATLYIFFLRRRRRGCCRCCCSWPGATFNTLIQSFLGTPPHCHGGLLHLCHGHHFHHPRWLL